MKDSTKLGLVALGAGLVAAGAVVIPLALRKGQDLELRGQLLSASLNAQGNALQTLLTADGSAMRGRLETYANQAAMDHLAQAYGLTPDRIAGMQRLFARYGIS